MAVRTLEITRQTPFAQGRGFGDTGPYDLLRCRATVELDPSLDVNRAIVDLDEFLTSPSSASSRLNRTSWCLVPERQSGATDAS